MSRIAIDPARCIGCGQCVWSCPAVVLEQPERGKPPVGHDERTCIHCGHCVAVCPKGALSHRELDAEGFVEIVADWDAGQVEHLLRAKRSVRHYQDKPVPREVTERLLAVAAQAPSDGNSQERRFLVLNARETIDGFEAAIIAQFQTWVNAERAKGAPDTRPDLAKGLRFLAAAAAGWRPIFRNAPCVIGALAPADNHFGAYNAIVAMDYLMLQAAALGLGSCIIGAACHDPSPAHLALPAGTRLQSVITLGYPKFKYRRTVPRRAPEVIWR